MLVDIGTRYINTDHIISIEPSAGGCTATLINGKTVHLPEGSFAIEDLCGTIVPAPSHMVLVEAFLPSKGEDDRKVHYRTSTVIAFRITEGSVAPVPIGAFGEPRTSLVYDYAVIQPDGRCLGWEWSWDSLDAFKDSQQAEADAQRQSSQPATAGSPDAMHLKIVSPVRGSGASADAPTASRREEIGPKGVSLFAGRDRSPSAIDDLRARILAEPILGLTPDAPWRAERDLTEVIAEVRAANPQLHTAGVGHDPKWGWKWKHGDMERHREAMTEPGLVEEFERALRFLGYAGQRFGQAKVNRKRTSYAWKHVAERVMGAYISNGMLVTAAYALGFTVATNDSPNPYINLGDKAAELDPHGGL